MAKKATKAKSAYKPTKSKSKSKSKSPKPTSKKSINIIEEAVIRETSSSHIKSSRSNHTPEESKSENQKWIDFASSNKITKPFFQVNGTVYRTSDGKGYHTPEQFFGDGGQKNWSNVHVIS